MTPDELTQLNTVAKTQQIRLLDVGLIGPLMIWGGMAIGGKNPRRCKWAGTALAFSGIATMVYNGGNWHRLNQARKQLDYGAPDPLPQVQPDGSVLVSPEQARLHRKTEAVALWVGAPFMLWLATRERRLSTGERTALAAFAVGTILVDGYLWSRFRYPG